MAGTEKIRSIYMERIIANQQVDICMLNDQLAAKNKELMEQAAMAGKEITDLKNEIEALKKPQPAQ